MAPKLQQLPSCRGSLFVLYCCGMEFGRILFPKMCAVKRRKVSALPQTPSWFRNPGNGRGKKGEEWREAEKGRERKVREIEGKWRARVRPPISELCRRPRFSYSSYPSNSLLPQVFLSSSFPPNYSRNAGIWTRVLSPEIFLKNLTQFAALTRITKSKSVSRHHLKNPSMILSLSCRMISLLWKIEKKLNIYV